MIEKAFMVYLVVSNLGQAFSGGFVVPAVMDSLITVWSVLYFVSPFLFHEFGFWCQVSGVRKSRCNSTF